MVPTCLSLLLLVLPALAGAGPPQGEPPLLPVSEISPDPSRISVLVRDGHRAVALESSEGIFLHFPELAARGPVEVDLWLTHPDAPSLRLRRERFHRAGEGALFLSAGTLQHGRRLIVSCRRPMEPIRLVALVDVGPGTDHGLRRSDPLQEVAVALALDLHAGVLRDPAAVGLDGSEAAAPLVLPAAAMSATTGLSSSTTGPAASIVLHASVTAKSCWSKKDAQRKAWKKAKASCPPGTKPAGFVACTKGKSTLFCWNRWTCKAVYSCIPTWMFA